MNISKLSSTVATLNLKIVLVSSFQNGRTIEASVFFNNSEIASFSGETLAAAHDKAVTMAQTSVLLYGMQTLACAGLFTPIEAETIIEGERMDSLKRDLQSAWKFRNVVVNEDLTQSEEKETFYRMINSSNYINAIDPESMEQLRSVWKNKVCGTYSLLSLAEDIRKGKKLKTK